MFFFKRKDQEDLKTHPTLNSQRKQSFMDVPGNIHRKSPVASLAAIRIWESGGSPSITMRARGGWALTQISTQGNRGKTLIPWASVLFLSLLSFVRIYLFLFYMCDGLQVCMCIALCLVYKEARGGLSDHLKLELKTLVRHCVGAGN